MNTLLSLWQRIFDPHPALLDRLAWTLVHFLWQGLLIAAAAAIVLLLLRRRSASARYLAACASLAIMAAAPAATFLSITPSPPPTSHPAAISAPIPPDINTAQTALPASSSMEQTLEPRQSTPSILPAIVWSWTAGVLALSLWRLAGWLHLRQALARRTDPLQQPWPERVAALAGKIGLRGTVRLLRAAWIDVPSVLGLFRPVILLPASALTGLPPSQLDALIAHELAHVKRSDYLVNLLQCAVETLLFYHPAVWWLSRHIRIERENCCDDLASRACGDPILYARALASMEELRLLPPHLALSSHGAPLNARIRRLLDAPQARSAASPWLPLLILLAAAAALLLPMTASTTDAQDQSKPPAAQSPNPAVAATQKATATAPALDGLELTPVAPEDLIAKPEDYTLSPNDLLTVKILELAGPGAESVRSARVSETGIFSLPLLPKPLKAAGLTVPDFEREISKAYNQAGILQRANVSVSVVEARGRNFSILGDAGRPGQYNILDSDFRILDALATSGTGGGDLASIRVIRKRPSPEPGGVPRQPRIIEVQVKPLLAGDIRQNLVIRPSDVIIVTLAPDQQAQLRLLNQRQATLHQQLEQALSHFASDHPRVQSLKSDLNRVQQQIERLNSPALSH